MFAKKFLLLVAFLLLLSNLSFSATIIVTSNADTGPGTLREALTIAAGNGTTVADIIQFNLPGSLVSDRTIRLKSQLPFITSNVTIDGTTQPGIAFGVSDARVIIEPETSPVYFNALNINGEINTGGTPATKIAIYGLYIRNFAKITSLANVDLSQGSGLMMQGNVSGIIIGAPGKGNVFCGNINGIFNIAYYYSTALSDIQIQSNIIGLLDDGFTAASNYTGINLGLDKDGLIGGTDANMGNVIAANVTGINITRANNFGLPNTITIQNNKIGTDYTGKADFKDIPLLQQSAFIKAYGINVNSSNTTVNITANLVSGQRYCGIYIENSTFKITANKIGTDVTGTNNLGNSEGIHAGTSSSGTIGGSAAADKNFIGFNNYGIEALNSVHTLITRNSIFCNSDYGISVSSNYYQVPFVQVLNFSGTAVSGTATPNCSIELFLSDDCGNICQGKTYITTVQSNGSGVWNYSGVFSKAVIATATDANNNTSPFSSLVIQDNDVVVKNYTCAYQGSITIQQNRTGLLFHWDKKEINGSLTPIGDTQNIKNLLPGTYQLTVQYPGGCQKITQLFEIKDLRIKIQNVIVPTPQCRQKFFLFDVNFTGGTGNVSFAWKDKNGQTQSTGKAANLPEGTYTVTISDEAGCAVTSSPAITIKAKPGPDYDLSTMTVTTARCGIAEGGISNITTTVGIGTLTYKWTDATGKTIATTKDLAKVNGGYYTLTLYDQSECSPYSTPPIFIEETNSVNINGGFITPAKCGNNDGAITGVSVQNADLFQWYGPQGNQIPTNQNNLDIANLSDGVYRLNALNTVTKCSNDRYFTVNRLALEVFTIKSLVSVPTTCGLNNGAISLEFDGEIIPSSYQWLKQDGTLVGSNASIGGLAAGFYTLNVTDKNGCPSVLVNNYEVKVTPLLQFSSLNNPFSKPDQCDQLFGSITGVDVTGGVPPYKYSWTNTGNNAVVGTDKDLKNVGKGDYSLVVTDNTACAIPLTVERVVDNNEFVPDEPVVNNQRICDPETVTISVRNPVTGTYKLYADATSVLPLLTNTTGEFSLPIAETSDFYVSYSIGTCESNRAQTHIEIVHVDVKKPNSFTPNGDGTNDYWKIEGLEKFPGSLVQVFNRYGQKVFESKEYKTVFTGKFNNQLLPPGVYYYIINLNTPCSLLSGSLTIIR
ncbi:gliding motility-associated C-terminal domain-containing protein [Mucilaginibacter sp. FT3.2]|uniref:T9SS type B sorting domain-containing protein n=1 Tax=Mucilaginibacter sp. FT3.2 TaxID=2723090 RepID=UPI00161D2D2E|nr:gliding motility-associated C-terminal domain-containing protein [Mucilaginibacter sp. FT3.2]MBB6232209.1 gliding motility-associated-like protein [Mucilaginibacter sp. FT3.2]